MSTIVQAQSQGAGNPHLMQPVTSHPPLVLAPGVRDDWNQIDFTKYIELHTALSRQQFSFKRERAAFVEERKLWEKERAIMKRRIADLEHDLDKIGATETARMAAPFSPSRPAGSADSHHVWEGSSPGLKPTRIFADRIEEHDLHLANPDEHRYFPPSLDDALSPRSRPVDRPVAVSVPIQMLDSSLDGITLKSTALPRAIVAKVSSPPYLNLAPQSAEPIPETKPRMQISLPDLGSPGENLTRHAGHTPKAIIGPDAEGSDSSPPDIDEDPALQGPLSLQNDDNKDNDFLRLLHQKLLDEARNILSRPSDLDMEENSDDESLGQPDPEPDLRFKMTTNFGTAFGSLQYNCP